MEMECELNETKNRMVRLENAVKEIGAEKRN